MLQAKQKKCDGCNEITNIWKKEGKQRFCKQCWSKQFKGLSSTKKPTAKKPLSPRSSKQEKLDVLYSTLRGTYLRTNPMCKAKLPGCQINATDVHHMVGRTGDRLLDSTNFLAVCRTCHNWIEVNPKEAKLLGFSKSREES
jgi:hypothetical protein